MSQSIEIIQPDDFHHHLRDNEVLKDTVGHAERNFDKIIVMPNLSNPVVNLKAAMEYRDRILAHTTTLTPLMTLYLTDVTSPEVIEEAQKGGVIAVKMYPRGATTNAENGITDILKMGLVFQVAISRFIYAVSDQCPWSLFSENV
jgi:dihydroorotase